MWQDLTIYQAENGATKADRIVAERKATEEAILKIWEHRTALPGKGYPLAAYKDILDVLQRLTLATIHLDNMHSDKMRIIYSHPGYLIVSLV